jgi:hypothetical protein
VDLPAVFVRRAAEPRGDGVDMRFDAPDGLRRAEPRKAPQGTEFVRATLPRIVTFSQRYATAQCRMPRNITTSEIVR